VTIPASLMVVNPGNPSPIAVWQLSVVNRNAYYADAALDAQIASLLGATTYYDFPYEGRNVAVNIYSDGVNAIIAIEGTRTFAQILGQVAYSQLTQQFGMPSGISCSTFVWSQAIQVERLITSVLPTLQGINVCLVGHSLGGAVAMALAYRWRNPGLYNVQSVVTFGAPRAGNAALAAAITGGVTRIVNGADPIPSLPYFPAVLRALILSGSVGTISDSYANAQGSQNIGEGAAFSAIDAADDNANAANIINPANIATPLFSLNVSTYHGINQYADALAYAFDLPSTARVTYSAWLAPVFAMNGLDIGGMGLTPGPAPSVGQVASPTTAVNPTSGALDTPVQDVGLSVELWDSDQSLIANQDFAPLLRNSGMATYKYTLFFQAGYLGWSESYWSTTDVGQPTSDASIALIEPLVTARMGLAGGYVELIAIRCSKIAVPQVIWPTPPRNAGLLQYGGLPLINAGLAPTQDPNVAIIIQCLPLGVNSQPKLIYLRGFPLAWFATAESLVSPFPTAMRNALNAFSNVLCNANYNTTGSGTNFAWLGRASASAKSKITALTGGGNLTTPQITITTMTPQFPAAAQGFPIPIHISGIKQTPKNLNGPHPFIPSSTTVATSKNPIAAQGWDGSGYAFYPGQQLVQFGSIAIQRVGERKTGRPYDTERGRAPIRPTA
jgi:pimeloyl-ACP methyl ester carboxylesterase